MIGMLQLIIWMGCAYLVLKGLSILQMSLTSARENQGIAPAIGWLCIVFAIVAACFFFFLSNEQANVVSSVGNDFPY